jgi:hypothetical protein
VKLRKVLMSALVKDVLADTRYYLFFSIKDQEDERELWKGVGRSLAVPRKAESRILPVPEARA